MTVGEFHEAVYQYCLLTGGYTTSGIRTKKHNAAVGGVPFSPHLFALGEDILYDDVATHTDPARLEIAKRLGLKIVVEGDHDHAQPWDWPAG